MENNKSLFDESRIYEENGEVKVRHIINESQVVDMTPHPTETRVFIKDGEVKWIHSKEIQEKGTSLEVVDAISDEIIDKNYLLP